jgi:hypothetical protein
MQTTGRFRAKPIPQRTRGAAGVNSFGHLSEMGMLGNHPLTRLGFVVGFQSPLFASTKIVQLTNEFDELFMIFFNLNSGYKAGHLFAFFRGHRTPPENVGFVNWRN